MANLDFDIVIATRNRRDALRLSLPLMLGQDRLPRRLVLVDSSDDHGEIVRLVEGIVAKASPRVGVEIARSAPGSSLQRNMGLKMAVSPVVLLPDDDALWFPGFSEAVMRLYERDEEGLIGGVGGTESPVPPPGVLDDGAPGYRMAKRDVLQLSLGRFLDALEYRFFPDPFFLEADSRAAKMAPPLWLSKEEASIATTVPGFRMSFRTGLIREGGFDEDLGVYSLFEDYDASLSVLENHLLIEARKAKVFHWRAPQARVSGVEWGVMQVLNRAYVICKHSAPASPARKRLLAYSWYKLARYVAQAQKGYGRQRVRGAAKALRLIPALISAPRSQLPTAYAALREQCLGPVVRLFPH